MESIELLLAVAVTGITGLVGLMVWTSHARALEQMKQDNLNHRAAMKAGASPAPTQQADEPDLMAFIMDFATKNPEMVNAFLSGMKGQQPPNGGMTTA